MWLTVYLTKMSHDSSVNLTIRCNVNKQFRQLCDDVSILRVSLRLENWQRQIGI